MRILVTGTSGFIGSALSKRLVELGHEVFGMYRYVADGRYNFYKLNEEKVCDIRNREGVFSVIREVRPETVYHLAAMTPVSYSFLSPIEVSEVIYMGTMNIVDACVEYKVGHFVNASTSEFYGKQEKFPITEEAIPKPFSAYAVAKLAAEEYIRYVDRTVGVPYTIIRPYNTYNRSWVKKKYFLIERAITQALEEGQIHLYTPDPIRDLLDRDSHVDAYVRCLGNPNVIGEAINIGTGKGWIVGDVVELVAKLVGEQLGKEIPISWDMNPDRPYDIPCLICSNEKAWNLLGWKPLYTLEEGLKIAIKDWRRVLNV